MEIIENLFRNLMFFFDNIIYGLIPTIYKLFIYLSEINLYSNDESNPLFQLVQHVYVLLGIFMLFKVSFSLLQYIVDPNAFRDSSKGMGKLVTNVLVALVLLVAVPYIFSAASELQTVIIQKNVIGQLILGTNASSNDDGTDLDVAKAEEMAKDLQFMLYGAFYRVDESVSACSGTSGVFGSIDVAKEEKCLDYLNTGISEENNAAANGVNLYSFFKHAPGAQEGENCNGNICDDRNFQDFGTLLWWKDNGNYVIDYLPFISSAVGVYVVFLLISFSVDIAVRAIKLCFLQMVAPVAIVSYIDPKESISNGKLHNWIKESASTYFSLFLRLATIFFVMLLVQLIASSVLSDGQGQSYVSSQMVDESYNIWIYLFLVIGAFMFAKQVPKLIESIFGIKGSGDFNLNPFKSFANVRDSGFGALAGGAIGLGVGAAASGVAAFSASKDEGAGIGTSFRRGLGGAAGGALRGTKAGFQSGGKQTLSKAMDVAGIAGRNAALKTNTKFSDRMGAYARQAVGMQSKKEGLDKQIGYHNDIKNHASNMESRARDQLGKKSDNWKWYEQQRANLQEAAKKNEKILWRQTDAKGKYVKDAKGNYIEQMVDSNDSRYSDAYTQRLNDLWQAQEKMVADYVDSGGKIQNGSVVLQDSDYQIALEKSTMHREIKENELDYMRDSGGNLKDIDDWNWKDIKDSGKAAEETAASIKSTDEYQNAETIDQMQKSGIMQSHFGSKH